MIAHLTLNANSFVIALPTIGIFGLKLKRFSQFVGTIAFFLVYVISFSPVM